MDAVTLNCPNCGAPSRDGATQCTHCGSRLAKTACPSCFGLIFAGAKHCQHCGAKIARESQPADKPHVCPRCKVDLHGLAIGPTNLHECPRCDGLWIDVETFDTICTDRERQAAVLGGTPAPVADSPDFKLSEIRYVGCCVCGKLMNRVNFSGRSGVIVDVCKAHGIWFDREELRRIIEFIHAGGVETARRIERERWEAERRRIQAARNKPMRVPGEPSVRDFGTTLTPIDLADAAAFVGRAIWSLLK